jgi:protein associated with RNAse G/E
VLRNNKLSFVDLDLDLVKRQNEDWQVIDIEEFEVNSSKYSYPPEFKEEAIQLVEELKRKITGKEFPFDDTPLKMLK